LKCECQNDGDGEFDKQIVCVMVGRR
jgi:hypothetical protein